MSLVTEIFAYIGMHWVEWAFAVLAGATGILYRKMFKSIKDTAARDKSIADGVQSILRDRIIQVYNYYKDKGYCPIYAQENVKRLYEPYHSLGGNDVATGLVEKLLDMPTEPQQE